MIPWDVIGIPEALMLQGAIITLAVAIGNATAAICKIEDTDFLAGVAVVVALLVSVGLWWGVVAS